MYLRERVYSIILGVKIGNSGLIQATQAVLEAVCIDQGHKREKINFKEECGPYITWKETGPCRTCGKKYESEDSA